MYRLHFVLPCAVCLFCGLGAQHDHFPNDLQTEEATSKLNATSMSMPRLGSLSQLLLHSASPAVFSLQHPNRIPNSKHFSVHSRVAHSSPVMVFGKAMQRFGQAMERAGEAMRTGEPSFPGPDRQYEEWDDYDEPYRARERFAEPPRRYQEQPPGLTSRVLRQGSERSYPSRWQYEDEPFERMQRRGFDGPGGFAKNMMRGVVSQSTHEMAQTSAVNERIMESVLDAIQDDAEARKVLGFNPTFGSPTKATTTSKIINGISTTKSSITLPLQGKKGGMWTAQVDAELTTNAADLTLKRVMIRSPNGRSFTLKQDRGRRSDPRRMRRYDQRYDRRPRYDPRDEIIDIT